MPYESTEVLASRGLVKIILPKGMTLEEGTNMVKIDVSEHILGTEAKKEASESEAEAVVPEETADEPVEPVSEEPAVEEPVAEPEAEAVTEEETAEPVVGETVAEVVHTDALHADELLTDEEAESAIEHIHNGSSKRTGKLAEINLDVICDNFEDGDVVDINALKAKHLVNRKAGRIKVLARGIMTKSLTVIASKFSLQAVKMITLAGGHADEED